MKPLKPNKVPSYDEIREIIGKPLGLELNNSFLLGFQSGWFNRELKIKEWLTQKRKEHFNDLLEGEKLPKLGLGIINELIQELEE